MRGAVTQALAVLLLASCGGGLPGRPETIRVEWAPLVAPQAGHTEVVDGETVVLIRDNLTSPALESVVIHELLHAVGILVHLADPACYLHSPLETAWPAPLCGEEEGLLREVTGTYTLVVDDPELYDACVDAAWTMNGAAGRILFVGESIGMPRSKADTLSR